MTEKIEVNINFQTLNSVNGIIILMNEDLYGKLNNEERIKLFSEIVEEYL